MAAIAHLFTIRRAAQILGREEDLLWGLLEQFEPEDGMLWVYDIDDVELPAFTIARQSSLRSAASSHPD